MLDLKELQDVTKNVIHSETKLVLIGVNAASLAQNETGYTVPIPYKEWKVVALGFVVVTGGVSTENPVVSFGSKYGDLAEDANRFGTITQDITATKEFVAEDVYVKDPKGLLDDPLALGGAGTPVWGAGGDELDVWQTNIAVLEVVRPDDHVLTVIPFFLLEVKIK